jgi:hypothetical protein
MPDGRRVQVRADNRSFTLDVYDWEIKPLTLFVDSGHSGSINIDNLVNAYNVTLDQAFHDSLFALRAIHADLREYRFDQKYLPRLDDQVILGAGEVLGNSREAERAAALFNAIVGQPKTRFTVITDAGVDFIFRLRDGKVAISDTPFLYAWNLGPGDSVVPDLEYNKSFAANWELLSKANPVGTRWIERTFRLAAFLRYQKTQSLDNWTNFFDRVKQINERQIRTPMVLEVVCSNHAGAP